jgi:hypothetical protein
LNTSALSALAFFARQQPGAPAGLLRFVTLAFWGNGQLRAKYLIKNA